ncbi:hypothetical protein GJ668_02070 [Allochromatium palmeri]|uniref:DUF4007 family protein n=2 Tax=Allochromatium palmeri TaxID=231048 RepID=A0A6N8E6Y2_9GAMM|nr:hypothetical protein [Allochromatium palmeri]
MIRYALGMGLISAEKTGDSWRLNLTPLGAIVQREDPFLSEQVTLWLLHLLLSRRYGHGTPAVGVADAWFTLFAEGWFRLGSRFTQADYLDFLRARHGEKRYLKSLSGLVPRMYAEDSSFAAIGALTLDDSADEPLLVRAAAPAERPFFPAYAAYLYLLWDERYGEDRQLAFAEFARDTHLTALLGWNETQVRRWLDWMADTGLVKIDRYTGNAVLLRLQETRAVVNALYSELI